MKTLVVQGIVCPKCDEFVWSRHRHDFRACGCNYCAIDGGREYSKVSFGGLVEPVPEPHPAPKMEERAVKLTKEDHALVAYAP